MFLFIIYIATAESIYTQQYNNYLTRSIADNIYCKLNGNCILNNLIVYNLSVIGDYINISVIDYNVTGNIYSTGNITAVNLTLSGLLDCSGKLYTDSSGNVLCGVDNDTHVEAVNPWLYKLGVSVYFNESHFNISSKSFDTNESARVDILDVRQSADNATLAAEIDSLEASTVKGSGTAGYLALWNETDVLNSSVIYQNDSYIGIGTGNPLSTLNVNGSILIDYGNALQVRNDENDDSLNIFSMDTNEDMYFGDSIAGNDMYFQNKKDIAVSIDAATNYVGIGNTTSPSYQLSVASTDGTDQIGIYHDNSDAFLTWNDGGLYLITDEGTDTTSSVSIIGKGTGYGQFLIYDQDNAEYLKMYSSGGTGYIATGGTSPGPLKLQGAATSGVQMFHGATEGETQNLNIYGYRTGDASRSLEIGVGTDAADTASFDGVSNYYFDGNITSNVGNAGDGIKLIRAGNTKFFAKADGTVDWGSIGHAGTLSWDDGLAILTSQTGQNLSLRTNGLSPDRLFITTSGNVGIGTTAPGYKMHIASTGESTSAIESAAAQDVLQRFIQGGTTVGWLGYDHSVGGMKITADSGFGAEDDLVILNNGNVGIGTAAPGYKFSIGSTDGTDQVGIYHDNTNAIFRTTDGAFFFKSAEGTNTNTYVSSSGKGTGYGAFIAYDEDDAEYLSMTASGGSGYLRTAGTSPSLLRFQDTAHANIDMFASATEGEIPELIIYGYRTGDSKRSLEIGVGTDVADTASFDGVSNYYFDGNINATKSIQAGNYTSSDGSLGITDTTSYWLCTAADCSTKCQVEIKNGLIVGCS